MFRYTQTRSLCLIREKELAPFLQKLKESYPEVEMTLFPRVGTIDVRFQSEKPVDAPVQRLQEKFATFFYGEGSLEGAVQRECIARRKTVALAESCTGGALGAKIISLPGASQYFLGSIVAYSNEWKERFLQVSRTTLKKQGAVSREVVIEMVQGLFQETNADFAVAVSGIAGPSGGTKEKPVGTVYIAIGERGHRIDAGVIYASQERASTIDLTVHLALGALWRRIVHNTATFS